MSQKRPNEDADHDSGPRPQAPKPSPRTRACIECKRHKIKCEPIAGESKCAKCIRSGLECVPHNLSQKLQDEDAVWKANATAELTQLRHAVQRLLRHSQLPELSAHAEATPIIVISPANVTTENGIGTTMVVPPMDLTRENSIERDLDEEAGLVTAPMRSLYDLTRIRYLRSSIRRTPSSNSMSEDFIAQGIISLDDAEFFFNRYKENTHQLLWQGMLVPYTSLDSLRRHSTLLAAAVLAVAAYLTPGRDDALQKCYNVFTSLTYSACLSRLDNVDDVRALLLPCFYISNLSWKLSGLAVRNAVEMGLHQSYQKLARGHTDQRDNVRLWYALYVCEHQFSIAYGRPPLLHDDVAIRKLDVFLDSPHTTPGDIRLGAQVALFKILTEAYMIYGSDPEQPLTEQDFQQLRMFNFAIEQWRILWQPRSADSPSVGTYPSKGVVLYYHFARFQLNSLALRALPPPSAASSQSLSYDRREAANIAISAATSTLTLIFEEPDLRRALHSVPVFTHTMVAFSVTFLLKMAKTWGGVGQAASPEWTTEPVGLGLNFNMGQVLSLSRRSADLLARVAETLNEKHLIRHIVHGIRELLKHFESPETPASQGSATVNVPHAAGPPAVGPLNGDGRVGNGDMGLMNGYNNMYNLIGSYGFGFDEAYLGQATTGDFDLWSA